MIHRCEVEPGVWRWTAAELGVTLVWYTFDGDLVLTAEPVTSPRRFGVRLVDGAGRVYAESTSRLP